MRRREFIAGLGSAAAWPLVAWAQRGDRVRRIGVLRWLDENNPGVKSGPVLIRLAFAEMLVERRHPATVILDDALAFSDDRRMQLMFDILKSAARNVQVLILTCREELFEGLGGKALSLTAGSSEELLSA